MTPDGNTVWVGVAGTNTVDKIDLVGGSDANQVSTSFKKSDGTAAPPNIVAVQPK
jgi:DNA-binding beta-propeller fold protein YncE